MSNLKFRRPIGVLIGVAVVATMSSVLSAGPTESSSPPSRPKYDPVLPQNEDWSLLRNRRADEPSDFFDPIKYISLDENGDYWLSFGGQARLRYEVWEKFNFRSDSDDTFLLGRARLHADAHFTKAVRVYAEMKSALVTERDLPGGTRVSDEDTIDLQQLFADVRVPIGEESSITLRGGRQMLRFGKQRLISPLDYSNSMRTWDGFSGILSMPYLNVTGFWTRYVTIDKYRFNNSDPNENFYGAYVTVSPFGEVFKLDLYGLGRDLEDTDDHRYTLGGRAFGKLPDCGFDYDVEGAYQFGDVAGKDVDAFMIGLELGYTFVCPASPRLWAGFDYASGDANPSSGSVSTFDPLYPLGHAYLGYIDFVGRKNIIDANLGVSISPIKPLTIAMAGHSFYLAESADGLYSASNAILRAGSASAPNEVGQELDLTVEYRFDPHTLLHLSYSHFFPGPFVRRTGASGAADWIALTLQYTF